ncbi:MAG: ABC transporter ATP-binding protein, partial [Myxococcales bacterium]|nr:ABC transporter ATP-binding protein [Myxococcales bacterium]
MNQKQGDAARRPARDDDGGLLARFWRSYMKRHTRSYLAGGVFLLATTALTIAIPVFVQHAVDAIGGGTASDAVGWAWAILIAGVAIMGVRTLSRIYFFNPGRVVEYDIKNDLFGHLTEMPQRYFDRVRPGEIISRGTNDTGSVRAFVGFGSLQLFNVVMTLVFTLGQMLLTNALLTLLCIIPLAIAAFVLRYAIKKMLHLVTRSQQQVATLSERALETYNGAVVLQSFNAVAGATRRFDDANAELKDLSLGLVGVQSWLLPIVQVVGNACLIIVLYAGGRMVIENDLTKGELAAFSVYIRTVAGALFGMGWLINALQRGWVSLKRVYEVLDAPNDRPKSAAVPLPTPGPGGNAIAVKNLTFRYPVPPRRGGEAAPGDAPLDGPIVGADGEDRRPVVLEDVSFEVTPGEVVGIFGLTGAGKSTLLNVLGRVYEPPVGTVFVDGVDVRDVPLAEFWRELAYVPQDAFLFSTSIRENIALAAPMGERDDARVEAAASSAALNDDLSALHDGVDTIVGARGVTLSGGQRQ